MQVYSSANLNIVVNQVGRLCPVVAGGVVVGSVYWTCVTYGAVTVMQVPYGMRLCPSPSSKKVTIACQLIWVQCPLIVKNKPYPLLLNLKLGYCKPTGAVQVNSQFSLMFSTCFHVSTCFVPQVAGHSDGLTLMENSDPLLLLVSLPLVPVGLVLSKMVGILKP